MGRVDFAGLAKGVRDDIRQEKVNRKKAARRALERRRADPLEVVRVANPGQTIYLLSAVLKCPWSACSARYTVASFVTKRTGKSFFFRCRACKEKIITLRDAEHAMGANTFPIDALKSAFDKAPHLYQRWMNMLWAREELLDRMGAKGVKRFRSHVVHPGDKDHRPITVRTSVESPEEARESLSRKDAKEWGLRK